MTRPVLTRPSGVMVGRLVVGALGAAAIGYGISLLLDQPEVNHPWQVAKWAIGADIVTDGILIPAIIVVGLVLRRVPSRARRYIQGALIAGGSVSLIALPLIYRQGKSQPGQGLLLQDYAKNLAVLLVVIAAAAATLYLLEYFRQRPPARDQP